MIPRLVVASKNPDKIAEIEDVLREVGLAGEIVRGLDWPDVEETGDTLEDNALLKARAVAEGPADRYQATVWRRPSSNGTLGSKPSSLRAL